MDDELYKNIEREINRQFKKIGIMTQEKKAIAYDEALERARNLHKDAIEMENKAAIKTCEIIFPELCESEDERIRKNLIAIFKGKIPYTSEEDAERYIAWLEKQGEQKPVEWTEEDEDNLNCCTGAIKNSFSDYKDVKELESWLKSLKQRI